MNYRDLMFYDFETTGVNPYTCQPLQLGAVVIHGRKLEIHSNSTFTSYIQPIWDEDECRKLGLQPVNDEALAVNKITREQLREAPSLETVWANFSQYVGKYNFKGGKWGAPVKAGMNIDKYDNIILDRICGGHFKKTINTLDLTLKGGIITEEEGKPLIKKLKKADPYGFGPWDDKEQEETLFFPRDSIDLMRIIWAWTENMKDIKSLRMDAMREWLGMSTAGAHDAGKDVEDGAKLLIKFLKLHRNFAPKVKFKDAFK